MFTFNGILKKVFGSQNERELKELQPILATVNALEPSMQKLTDLELKAQTDKFKNLISQGATLESILPEAFATVREASIRVLKMRHFDVQIMGGVVLYRGRISEMKTGEGKTLTATLPLYLYGLSGKGAHLVTVNDYLAARDSRDMGALLTWLGLSVGCITGNLSDKQRKEAYASDVTYGTNNEFVFDYLRDNMKYDLADYTQRGHNFCIVDEVDSILIDEARTPLHISGPSEGNTDLYRVVNNVVPKLKKDIDYKVDEKAKSCNLTDDGVNAVQEILKIDNLFALQYTEVLHHLNQSLRAHNLFTRDVDYVIKDNQVVIVDEFTGRLKEGSRWSDGLHQAIEARENLPIKSENQTLASITFQNYFRLYERLAGMTGTAETEAEEFRKIYGLEVTVLPTNMPMVRKDWPDYIYKNRAAKFRAVTKLIKELHEKGQPILVGTISIESSEQISNELKKLKIPHEVLNAKNHEREASIIANAGQRAQVTIATNMAGRGTDIKLTPESRAAGGLFILGTERHEARRMDNQLRGRSGRQGDPGESRFFLSLEDDLMRIFGSDRIKGIMHTLGMQEDEPIEHNMISNAIAKAQMKVEAHNFEIRKHLIEYDNVMNEQRKIIYRLRREILADQDNMGLVHEMIEDVCDEIIATYTTDKKIALDQHPWGEYQTAISNLYHKETTLSPKECSEKTEGELLPYLATIGKEKLAEKFKKYDPAQVRLAIREILLTILDGHWKDHLLAMDHLKEGIGLRAYAQKDPLGEYKRESFDLFDNMRKNVKRTVVANMFRVELYTQEEMEALKKKQQEELQKRLEDHKRAQESAASGKAAPLRRGDSKVGRNDDCPCGSGKKFKHCHGA